MSKSNKELLFVIIFAIIIIIIGFSFAMTNFDRFDEEHLLDNPSFSEDYIWTLAPQDEYRKIARISGIDERFVAFGQVGGDSEGKDSSGVKGKLSYGIIDPWGKIIIPFAYDEIDTISKYGLYMVAKNSVTNGKVYLWGYINDNNETIADLQYRKLKWFAGDYAVGLHQDKWKVFTIDGSIVYESEQELYNTAYNGIFRYDIEGITYLVNVSNGESIEFVSYNSLPWEVDEIEALDVPVTKYKVEEANGMWGIREMYAVLKE